MPGLLCLPKLLGSVLPLLPQLPPHPPSFPAEAILSVSLVFLPLSMSGNCQGNLSLRDDSQPPSQRCLHTAPSNRHFVCSLLHSPSLGPAPCHPCPRHSCPGPISLSPALKQLPVWQDTKDMSTNTRIQFRFGEEHWSGMEKARGGPGEGELTSSLPWCTVAWKAS